jgi:hypothetical protein
MTVEKMFIVCLFRPIRGGTFIFGMRPTQSISDLMRDIKGDSSLWINENKFVAGKFSWQEGFGAFSYSKSQISAVATYIENQELHHRKKSFTEEYTKMLQDFDIVFDEKYIFKPISD